MKHNANFYGGERWLRLRRQVLENSVKSEGRPLRGMTLRVDPAKLEERVREDVHRYEDDLRALGEEDA